MKAASQSGELVKRNTIKVYFLAAPEEEDECQAIRKYLVPAIRNSKIPVEIYSDFEIPAGEDKAKYKQKLLEADIVLALISSDYISDDETYERTQKVMERYNNNETILVPILVRNCLWKHTPFVKLPLLPKNLQPLNNKQFWNSEDDALMAVVEDIYEAINEFSVEEAQEAEPVIAPKVEEEKEIEPASASILQEVLSEQPEQLINGTELTEITEIQAEEFIPLTEPEKIIPATKQTVVSPPNVSEEPQTKKQKTVTPIEVDWRKQYYKKVLWKRLFAFILDNLIMIPVSFVCMFLVMVIMFISKDPEVTDLTDNEYLFVFVVTFCSYLVINAKMESSKLHATLGKRLLKLQITDKQGNPITFFRALGRNILRTIVGYSFVFIVPLIVQLFRFKSTKKLFHDQLSNTVIGERLNN
ncbi:MAG TPA: RDD family protein [Draconibacterium sp.]|nr:RDD family protein [Draconibacterium sp.]